MAEGEKSVTWIVIVLALFFAVLGWGFMASSYDSAQALIAEDSDGDGNPDGAVDGPGLRTPRRARGAALSYFIGNALGQLPNMGTVISWHLSNRVWLPILVLLAEVGVFGSWFALKRVEANLAKPMGKRKW